MNRYMLRAVTEVARQNSIAKAAEVLHLSPQGLGKQLDAVEAELDCRLFVRSAQGCALTPKGQIFVNRAPALIDEIDRFVEAVKWEGSALRIGYWPHRGNALQDDLNHQFAERYSHIKCIFVPCMASRLEQDILGGTIDVAFAHEEAIAQLSNLGFTPCASLSQGYNAFVSQANAPESNGHVTLDWLKGRRLAIVGDAILDSGTFFGLDVSSVPDDKHEIASVCESGGVCIADSFYATEYPGIVKLPIECAPSRIGVLHRPNVSPTVKRYLDIVCA